MRRALVLVLVLVAGVLRGCDCTGEGAPDACLHGVDPLCLPGDD